MIQNSRNMFMVTNVCLAVTVSSFTSVNKIEVFQTGKPTSVPRSAIKEATFGMGCFWEPSEALLKVDGVVDTVVGYTGNPEATRAPTYDSVCFGRQWVEAVRVTYDDEKISYSDLLDEAWKAQKAKIGSRQYSSIIFPHSDEQDATAREWMENRNENSQDSVTPAMMWTTIEPQSTFYQAEGYHQNYWQKQRPRFAAIIALLAISSGVLDSVTPEPLQQTVATAANTGVLAVALWQLLERKLDAKVVKL